MKKTKTRKINKTSLGFILILFFIVSLGIGFLTIQSRLDAVGPQGEQVLFVVEKGDNLDQVTNKLYALNLIQDQFVFEVYAKYVRLTDFKVGTFRLDYGYDVKTILSILVDASKIIPSDVVVTIIPGDWAKQIAVKLTAEMNKTTADELMALWNDEAYIRSLMDEYSVLTEEIFEKKGVRVLLEGYLMPETYFMNPNASADSLTRRVLNQTQKVYDENRPLFDAFGMSIHDVIILASVVQFEARLLVDMKMISQVFLNRLAINMPLQASATVCYALYEFESWKECESYENQLIDSPYNTYIYRGLPIGPITNPSKEALLATIQPIPNDYYYFLADVFGDGSVHYAKTFAEHLRNIDKYLKR